MTERKSQSGKGITVVVYAHTKRFRCGSVIKLYLNYPSKSMSPFKRNNIKVFSFLLSFLFCGFSIVDYYNCKIVCVRVYVGYNIKHEAVIIRNKLYFCKKYGYIRKQLRVNGGIRLCVTQWSIKSKLCDNILCKNRNCGRC